MPQLTSDFQQARQTANNDSPHPARHQPATPEHGAPLVELFQKLTQPLPPWPAVAASRMRSMKRTWRLLPRSASEKTSCRSCGCSCRGCRCSGASEALRAAPSD